MSVCTRLLCQSALAYRKHVCLKTLSVVCRLSVVTSWSCRATHGLPAYGPPCTVGVLPGPKSQPICVLVGVVSSCVLSARVRGRVSRSCATENTHTPPRLEALFKLSVVDTLRHSYRLLQHLCGCSQKPFNLFDTFFLVVGSVAIHLVYVIANLFLSLKIDQLRKLSRLSLDFTATGYALYFMSAVL